MILGCLHQNQHQTKLFCRQKVLFAKTTPKHFTVLQRNQNWTFMVFGYLCKKVYDNLQLFCCCKVPLIKTVPKGLNVPPTNHPLRSYRTYRPLWTFWTILIIPTIPIYQTHPNASDSRSRMAQHLVIGVGQEEEGGCWNMHTGAFEGVPPEQQLGPI